MNGEGSINQRNSDGRWFGSIVVSNELGQPKRKIVSSKTKDGARQKLRRLVEEHERLEAEGLPRWTIKRHYDQGDELEKADANLKRNFEAADETQRADLEKVDKRVLRLATGGLRLRSRGVVLIILGTIALTVGGALAA